MLRRPEAFHIIIYHLSFYVTRMENKFCFTTLVLMALAEDISDCDRHQKHLIANITQEITFGTEGNKPIFKTKFFHMASFWKWRFLKHQ